MLTRLELTNRGLINSEGEVKCPLCELDEESIDHLFVTCPVAWRLWCSLVDLFGVSWVYPGSWAGVVESWFHFGMRSRRKCAWNTILAVVLWSIWKERKLRTFEGIATEFNDLFHNAKWRLCMWLCANKEFSDCKAEDLFMSWEGYLKSYPRRRKIREVWSCRRLAL